MEGKSGGPERTGSHPSTALIAHRLPQQIASLFPTGIFCQLVLTEGTALTTRPERGNYASAMLLALERGENHHPSQQLYKSTHSEKTKTLLRTVRSQPVLGILSLGSNKGEKSILCLFFLKAEEYVCFGNIMRTHFRVLKQLEKPTRCPYEAMQAQG